MQGQVDEASTLLEDYNQRLQEELKDRKKVGNMISEFLSAQKDLLAQAEERLELYLDKLEKIHQVKDELKSHIASLPDIPVVRNNFSFLFQCNELMNHFSSFPHQLGWHLYLLRGIFLHTRLGSTFITDDNSTKLVLDASE